MTKQYEATPADLRSKETLARLLSGEGVTVRYGDYETASFDLSGRILRKPRFSNLSEEVDDLFTLHEVAHALYTPKEGWHTSLDAKKLEHRVLNILEDVRIERLIKKKYPGAARTFHVAYKKLVSNGFFGNLAGVRNWSFLDRLNVYAKIGGFDRSRLFTSEENEFVDRAYATETWDEVSSLAEDLSKSDLHRASMKFDFGQLGQLVEQDGGEEGPNSGCSEYSPEPGATDLASKEFEDKLPEDGERHLKAYLSPVTPALEISLSRMEGYIAERKIFLNTMRTTKNNNALAFAEGAFESWNQSLRKESLEMAAEFMAMKKAHSIAHSVVSKTGRVDVSKLYQATTRDDIFLRRTDVKKGKNHAFVLLVDMSSSMEWQISSVMDQAALMLLMCAHLGIKADIYGYTSDCYSIRHAQAASIAEKGSTHTTTVAPISIYHMGSTSNVALSLKTVFYLVCRRIEIEKESFMYTAHNALSMHMTPTADAVMAMEKYLRANLEVAEVNNLILFTDGDSCMPHELKSNRGSQYINLDQYIPASCYFPLSYQICDRQSGKELYYASQESSSCGNSCMSGVSALNSWALVQVAANALRSRLRREFNFTAYVSNSSSPRSNPLMKTGAKVESILSTMIRIQTPAMPCMTSFYVIRSDTTFSLSSVIFRGTIPNKKPEKESSIVSKFKSSTEQRVRRRAFGRRVTQDIAGLGF